MLKVKESGGMLGSERLGRPGKLTLGRLKLASKLGSGILRLRLSGGMLGSERLGRPGKLTLGRLKLASKLGSGMLRLRLSGGMLGSERLGRPGNSGRVKPQDTYYLIMEERYPIHIKKNDTETECGQPVQEGDLEIDAVKYEDRECYVCLSRLEMLP